MLLKKPRHGRKVPEAKRVQFPTPKEIDLLISHINFDIEDYQREPTQIKAAKHLFSIKQNLNKNRNKPFLTLSTKQAGNLGVYLKKYNIK